MKKSRFADKPFALKQVELATLPVADRSWNFAHRRSRSPMRSRAVVRPQESFPADGGAHSCDASA